MDDFGTRLARGDPAAFAELYDRCADRLYRYLVVRLGSRADADDVLHDTFVRLARTRNGLRQVSNLVAYVFAAARNETARFTSKRARRAEAELLGARSSEWCDAMSSRFEGQEVSECVASALARLEPELRDIVELKIYAGLTFQEISQVTGLPQGTVATRYRNAIGKMRVQLTRQRP